jgi:hypothetical protein
MVMGSRHPEARLRPGLVTDKGHLPSSPIDWLQHQIAASSCHHPAADEIYPVLLDISRPPPPGSGILSRGLWAAGQNTFAKARHALGMDQ